MRKVINENLPEGYEEGGSLGVIGSRFMRSDESEHVRSGRNHVRSASSLAPTDSQ